MGVIREAGRLLRSEERQFVGAADATDSAWTLRDALLVALGCHRRAGALAYWEWRELHAALQAARGLLDVHTGAPPHMDAERWANQRPLEEVLAALDAVPEEQDVQPLEAVTLRAWCRPSSQSTCRIPFIPIACLVHGWGDPARGWSETADRLGLTPGSSSWDVLDRLEPEIRYLAPPENLDETASLLRKWMVDVDAASTSPVQWLFDVTANEPSTALTKLAQRAQEAIDAHKAANA